MIEIDRDSTTPIREQLVEQLRYQLATGHFRPGDRLPSTRELGESLGVSFHTVRKAYQLLEKDGFVEARSGATYTVIERQREPIADRMERGAAIAHDSVQRLVGLGLEEEEIRSLIEEQLSFTGEDASRVHLVFAAGWQELCEAGARQLSGALQHPAEPVLLQDLEAHLDPDVIVVPHAAYHRARAAAPSADVIAVSIKTPPNVLAEIARLAPHETLGLITSGADAIGPLLRELRQQAGFTGPAIALESSAEKPRLSELTEEVDLLVYTPGARRKLRKLLADARSIELTLLIDSDSIEAVATAIRR